LNSPPPVPTLYFADVGPTDGKVAQSLALQLQDSVIDPDELAGKPIPIIKENRVRAICSGLLCRNAGSSSPAAEEQEENEEKRSLGHGSSVRMR
jgi:hypothetical protein